MSASQVLEPIDMHDGMVSIGTLMLHFLSDDLKAIRYSSALVMERKRGECVARRVPTKTGSYLN